MAGKALYEYGLQESVPVSIFSMHDPAGAAARNKYFPAEMFLGFNAAKATFIKEAVAAGSKSRVVIISHINLLVAGWLIKKVSPDTQIILLAHGIEVWDIESKRIKMMLHACDKIVSVSSFTCEKITKLHVAHEKKCFVLNNCIDPYLKPAVSAKANGELMKRYGIRSDDIILLTLTRLSARDRYKGYDHVVEAIAKLKANNIHTKYLLCGGYDADEAAYVNSLAEGLGVKDRLIMAGFVAEEELPAHFSLAGIYVMPSMKEGFGIVFVEAMFYGLPVVAGNADGSVDALLQGRLGLLIPPEKPAAIVDAVEKILRDRDSHIPDKELLLEHFSYETYKGKFKKLLN